jgi:hypothetical protein
MNVKHAKLDDLRMSAEEFDRITGKALQVKPEGTSKAKGKRNSRKRTAKKVT